MRQHYVPPAPHPRGELAILREIDDALGLVLWRAVRDIQLWSATVPEIRDTLFQPMNEEVRARVAFAEHLYPALTASLRAFVRLAVQARETPASVVSGACLDVSQWADRRGFKDTASVLAETAAYADPEDPTSANWAGYFNRRQGLPDSFQRADAWYRRALKLAIRRRHTREVIRSHLGMGVVLKESGDDEGAKQYFGRAVRRALSRGRRRQAGVAEHYLLGLAAESGNFATARYHARRALQYYPIHHPRIPALAHDIAFLLLRHGFAADAARLVEAALPLFSHPALQALVRSTAARAHGLLREPAGFADHSATALQLATIHPEYAVEVRLNVAEGARWLARWSDALALVRDGLAQARSRRNVAMERVAVAMLDEIEAGVLPPHGSMDEPESSLRQLVDECLSRLRAWQTPRRGRHALDPPEV